VLRTLAERRVRVYEAVVPLTPGRLGRRRGDVLSSLVDDVDSVLDRRLRIDLPVRAFAAVAVLATGFAAWVLPAAAPVVLATALLGGGLGFLLARTGAAGAERRSVAVRAELSALVTDTADVAEELVMWQAQARAVEAVTGLSRRLGRASVRAAAWLGAARCVGLLVTGAGVATMAVVAAPARAAGEVSGPMLALLVLLPLALGELTPALADAGALVPRTRAADRRLRALEQADPLVREPQVALPAPDRHDLTLDDVSASWDGRTPVLTDLRLRLAPGGTLGVVGPSGCGKSTLAALLLRFVDPVSGRVELGGRDLTALSLDDVRSRVGLVDDDPHVFASTLVENVRLARPGATDEEVAGALRQARLGPWLDDLPDGLHTWLGDGHAEVSGGERARLAVARSLLAGQPVLVLDEPTAHLDHATAEALAAEVLDASSRRSVVWITHGRVGLDRVDEVVDLSPNHGVRRRGCRAPTTGQGVQTVPWLSPG
jgi:ATP-binding cassette subfamily C protein CydCD